MPEHDLLHWAARAAQVLYDRGARRVWAFGSLGEGYTLDVHSDIDLAAEGVAPHVVEQTRHELSRQSPYKIDVIAMEEADAQLRWFVSRGRLLPRADARRVMTNARRPLLRDERLAAVAAALHEAGARTVLELGCGRARLVEALARDDAVERIVGVDMDDVAVAAARARLSSRLSRPQLAKVTLVEGLVTWRDPQFVGFDAVVAVEVIEHLAPAALTAFEHAVFGHARPPLAVVTTPNVEYNPVYGLWAGELRLDDHRFEMTRGEFRTWASDVAARHGYAFDVAGVGAAHPDLGAPTHLGRFVRR